MEGIEEGCSVGPMCYTCKATTGLSVTTAGSGRDEVCWTACVNCVANRVTLRVEPRAMRWMLSEHRRHRGLPDTTRPPEEQPRPLRIPDVVHDVREAADMVIHYFEGRHRDNGLPLYTGSMFTALAGGGDRPDVANQFTTDDIVAVSMLNANVSPRASILMLHREAGHLSAILADVPADIDLGDADDRHITDGSAATHLWTELRRFPGIGPMIAGKLLARKRPRLIPILDSAILQELDHPGSGYWRDLRTALHANDHELNRTLTEIRGRAHLDHDVSVIRIFDVLVWMAGKRASPPADGADPFR